MSDHETIEIQMKCSLCTDKSGEKVISWKTYSKNQTIANLMKSDWSNFYNNSIEEKLAILRTNIKLAVTPQINEVIIKNKIPPKNGTMGSSAS